MSADVTTAHHPASIGLCLSGGGFRASFYALGALRYIAEAGLFDRVTAISGVSGGSIAAAALGDRWEQFRDAGGDGDGFVEQIDAPFRNTVTTTNVRNRWMLNSVAAVVPFTGGRGGAYARTLANCLYEHGRVADLPAHPEFIFTSTDLSKGRAFRVSPAYIGSHDYGYIEPTPTSVGLGTAVAASAAFPPSFTVVNLKTSRLAFPTAPPRTLSLVDGGVYDNLGLEWFQGWGEDAVRPVAAGKPDFIIVVNASGPLTVKDRSFGPLRAFSRDLSIQYQQSLNLRVRWNDERMAAERGTGVYMAIRSDPRSEALPLEVTAAALPSELVRPLALLRTDLDRFSADEAGLLSYHAYWTLHARLLQWKPKLALAAPAWRDYADLSPGDTERLRRSLELGSQRFFRGIRARLRQARAS